jgi:hypothetical protein
MTNQYLWTRIVGPDPSLRAADADRERVAERLRQSHAEGRLDMTEFQERLERCYAAKTIGQLAELVHDLPRQTEQLEPRASGFLAPWRWQLPVLPILIGLIVVAAVTGHYFFWPWLLIVFVLWRVSVRRRRWSPGARRGPDDWI